VGLALLTVGCNKQSAPAPQGQAPAEEIKPVELRMVMFLHENAAGNFTNMWIEKVDEYSNGRIKIKVIGGPEAIPTSDQVSAVQQGVVDIANAVISPAEPFVPGITYLGRAEYSAAELRQRGVVAFLQEKFRPHGLYYLGASSPSEPAAQGTFFFKTKAVRKLEDFKGLKIATYAGTLKGLIEALGGSALSVNFTEYYTALERGVADGYLIGTPGISAFGLVPVTKYWLDEPVFSGSGAFFVNLKVWESLPQELKDALTKATEEFEVDAEKAYADLVAQARAEASAAGVEFIKLPPEDSVRFYQLYREQSRKDVYAIVGDKREILDELIRLVSNDDFYRLKLQPR
jgi:TRAP-type C4-dicarboxylate transport system substrate-binding protein